LGLNALLLTNTLQLFWCCTVWCNTERF